MPDLEAEWKLSIEFDNFANVDLFQRGYYQVRCRLKGPSTLSYVFRLGSDGGDISGRRDYILPASVDSEEKCFRSSVLNVQFRKEEFALNEVATATAKALVNGSELPDVFPLPLLELEISVFYGETLSGIVSVEDMSEISSRLVELHADSSNNVHYRLPLMFDYFHLARISFTVHCFLAGISSINQTVPPEKHWYDLFTSSSHQNETPPEPTLPKILFPNDVKIKKKKKRSFRGKLHRTRSGGVSTSLLLNDHALEVHRCLCDLLLSSLDSLVTSFRHLMSALPPRQQLAISIPEKSAKIDAMSESLRKCTQPAAVIATVEEHLKEVNSEAVLLWTQYTEVVSLNPSVIKALAEEHQYLAMSRFHEATIVFRWPRDMLFRIPAKCRFPHVKIAEAMHRSQYMHQAVAPLPLACGDATGTPVSMPILFEDHFDAAPHPPGSNDVEEEDDEPSAVVPRPRASTSSRKSDVHPLLRHSVSLSLSHPIDIPPPPPVAEATVALAPPPPHPNGRKHNRKSSDIPKFSSSFPGSVVNSSVVPNGTNTNDDDDDAFGGGGAPAAAAAAMTTGASAKKRRDPPGVPPINGTDLNWLIPHELADIDFSSMPPDFVREILESAAASMAATKESAATSAATSASAVDQESKEEGDDDAEGPPTPPSLPPPPVPPRRQFSPTARDKKLEPVKGELREMLSMNGFFLSDFPCQSPTRQNETTTSSMGSFLASRPPCTHVIVCVHGLDGNSNDLRSFRTFLEIALKDARLEFIMSEVNQENTFCDFNLMTDLFVNEVLHHIEAFNIHFDKISFIGHSLGNIIIRAALQRHEFEPLLDKLHTFLSLSAPHLGMLYNNSLVSTGMWLAQKWKKSVSLSQLGLKDHPDPRQTFLYQLSQGRGLSLFQNVLLVSSVQDQYVPYHSARIEMCRPAIKDSSDTGSAYKEMLLHLIQPIVDNPKVNLVRYDVIHHLPGRTADNFIGRAAHIAMLDSEVFIQKFVFANCVKYFT